VALRAALSFQMPIKTLKVTTMVTF
jgi:hypothetical protein